MRPTRSSVLRALCATASSIGLAACADPVAPPSVRPSLSVQLTAPQLLERYVALGTSNSMGVQSAGIFAAGQRDAWPSQLASRAGVAFTLPLVQDPGCGPPLLPPLAADLALVGAFGGDLVTGVMLVCAPLRSGITLPTNSVAISGAKVHDALVSTPERELARSVRTGTLYSRVLAPGQTQVTAMLAQRPTFVSVELAANEVLPASTGRVSPMTPYADWERDYDQVLAAVQTTGAGGLLVGVPNDAANFPTIRTARELFNEWPALLALGIRVSSSCWASSNRLFIPGYLLALIQKAPVTATCADTPGAADYVLTPGDITLINAQMARMNAHMQAKAAVLGFAYFSLDAVYGLPKPKFRIADVVFSATPFGANISLDGVHPSARGQTILATAAAKAIGTTYGVVIP